MEISIIIPLYNKEKAIKHTIFSVLNQSYADFELIVVDDGSTDKSAEIVKSIEDTRVHLIQKQNGGPSSARNFGVSSATTDWILFLDADDSMEEGCLGNFLHIVHDNPEINVFVSNFYQKRGTKKKLQSIFMRNGIVKNNFRSWFFDTIRPCQGAVLYKKDVLLKYPFPEYLRRWEDAAMFFKVMRNERIYSCTFPSFTYELDNSSASKALSDINADYLGHLSNMGSFWERMCVLILYKQARRFYPKECKELYGDEFFNVFDTTFFYVLRKVYKLMRIWGEINYRLTKSLNS